WGAGQGCEGGSPKNRGGGTPVGWGGSGGTGVPRQREAGPSCSRPGGSEPLCPQEPSLYTVKALLILDSRGQRLLAKYYDSSFPTAQEQAAFESSIFSKTRGAGGEIAFLEGLTVVYRSSSDLLFYVVGGPQENEEGLGEALAAGEPGRGLPGGGRDRGQGGDPGERPAARPAAPGPTGPRTCALRLRPLRLPGGQPRAGGHGSPPQVEAPSGCSSPSAAPRQLPPPALRTPREPLSAPEGELEDSPPSHVAAMEPKWLWAAPGPPGAAPAARLHAPQIKLLPPAPGSPLPSPHSPPSAPGLGLPSVFRARGSALARPLWGQRRPPPAARTRLPAASPLPPGAGPHRRTPAGPWGARAPPGGARSRVPPCRPPAGGCGRAPAGAADRRGGPSPVRHGHTAPAQAPRAPPMHCGLGAPRDPAPPP
uniref:AP complex mu/sigma subunit domain-containing protein n=1 Tax=Anser brachyrhynchus TaxID=132585 RepID=A0A8B9B8P7_9AVES